MRTWAGRCSARSAAAWAICMAGLRHITFSQEEALDHGLRAALRCGPTPVANLSRKLPDVLMELLSEEEGGLLGYLRRRNQMFLVRQEPGTMRNVASLTAAVAATGCRSSIRKAMAQSVELLSSSGYSQIEGVPIATVERNLPQIARQRIYGYSGSAMAFYLSFPDVFEVDPQRKTVKLVGPNTPLPPLNGSLAPAASSSAAVASTPHASAVIATTSSSSTVPAAPSPPPRTHSSSGAQALLRCANYNTKLLRVLQSYVPFSHHVTLKSLLSDDEARAAVLDAMGGGRRGKSNSPLSSEAAKNDSSSDWNSDVDEATLSRLVAELERIPSAMMDCRIFSMDSEGGSSQSDESAVHEAGEDTPLAAESGQQPFDQEGCFLRCLLDDDDVHMSTTVATRTTVRSSAALSSALSKRVDNDELQAKVPEDGVRLLPFVLDVFCEHYRVGLGTEEDVVSWLNRLLPAAEQSEGLFEAVPPPPLSILTGQQLIVSRAEAVGHQLGPDVTDVRRFLLWLERWPHLYLVNAETFEVAVRTEVFAAWLRVIRRRGTGSVTVQAKSPQLVNEQDIPVNNVDAAESISASGAANARRSDERVSLQMAQMQPTESEIKSLAIGTTTTLTVTHDSSEDNPPDILRCVLEEVHLCPGLAARRPSLTCKNTPVPRVLARLCSEISLHHTPLPLSVSNTAIVLASSWGAGEENELRGAFGSPLVQSFSLLVAYHPHIFTIRDPDGLSPEEQAFLSTIEPTQEVAAESVGAAHATTDGASSSGGGINQSTTWCTSLLQLWTHKALLHHKKQQTIESAHTYGNKKWSRSVFAHAIFDTLPSVESGDVVVWSHHQQHLLRHYRGIIPEHLVLNVAGFQLFREFAELFVVYEIIFNRPSSFLLARRGVKRPIGCHPSTCLTLDDALKQLAYVTLGGASEGTALLSLSHDARTLVKKHGGLMVLAQRFPQWFDVNVKGKVLTYIGARDVTVNQSVAHLLPLASAGEAVD